MNEFTKAWRDWFVNVGGYGLQAAHVSGLSGTRFLPRRHRLAPGRQRLSRRRGCTLVRVGLSYTSAPEISERTLASVAQKIQTLFIDDLDGSAAEGIWRYTARRAR